MTISSIAVAIVSFQLASVSAVASFYLFPFSVVDCSVTPRDKSLLSYLLYRFDRASRLIVRVGRLTMNGPLAYQLGSFLAVPIIAVVGSMNRCSTRVEVCFVCLVPLSIERNAAHQLRLLGCE